MQGAEKKRSRRIGGKISVDDKGKTQSSNKAKTKK
jgi:hypothetical protein